LDAEEEMQIEVSPVATKWAFDTYVHKALKKYWANAVLYFAI
jgi:hypothetical protein